MRENMSVQPSRVPVWQTVFTHRPGFNVHDVVQVFSGEHILLGLWVLLSSFLSASIVRLDMHPSTVIQDDEAATGLSLERTLCPVRGDQDPHWRGFHRTLSSTPTFVPALLPFFVAFLKPGFMHSRSSVTSVTIIRKDGVRSIWYDGLFRQPGKGCNICSSPSDPSKRSCHSPLTLLQIRRSAYHKPKSNSQTSQTLALPRVRGGSDKFEHLLPKHLSSIMKSVNKTDKFTPIFPSKSVEKCLMPWHSSVLARCRRASMFKKEAHSVGFRPRYVLEEQLPTLVGSSCFGMRIWRVWEC